MAFPFVPVLGGLSLLSGAASAFGRQDPVFDMSAPGGPSADPNAYMNAFRGGGLDGVNNYNKILQQQQAAYQQQERQRLYGIEQAGGNAMQAGLSGFQSALGNEAALGSQASLDFANLLGDYSRGGFMPGEQDISQANDLASRLFQARRVAQTQAFSDQLTQANRQAALSGRGMNDPILRAKLAQEQTRQGELLNAEQGSFSAQFAQSLPFQRAQFAGQRADVLNQRGQQALGNQLQLAQLGSGLQQQLWGQRYQQAAGQMQAQAGSSSFGERLGSALNAGISGVGAGMSLANLGAQTSMFNRMGTSTLPTTPMSMPGDARGFTTSGTFGAPIASAPARTPSGASASWASPWQPSYSPFVSAPNYITPYNQGPQRTPWAPFGLGG